MDIQQLRDQIDGIDDELVRLFIQRMGVASQIADYKKEHGLHVIFFPQLNVVEWGRVHIRTEEPSTV